MFIIRRASPKDAEPIHFAHMRSIQQVCSKDHSAEEVAAWGNRPYREDQRLSSINNDLIWVVDSGESIEGYGHLKIFEEDGEKRAHVLGLYLTPKAIGRSLGKEIFSRMSAEMRAAKVGRVTLESTLTAQNFYRKLGFKDAGPEMKVEIAGVGIRCIPMEMSIAD